MTVIILDNYNSVLFSVPYKSNAGPLIPACSDRRKNTELNPADLILAKLPLKSVRVL